MEPPSNLLSTIKYSGINIKGKSEMVRVVVVGGERLSQERLAEVDPLPR